MVKLESQCCGCPSNMGCIGDHCMYRYTPVYTCDECKEEADELYEYDGTQVCLDCLLDIINAKRVK